MTLEINFSDMVGNGLRAHWPRLWRYCLALTKNRDHAEDLIQATAIRALEATNTGTIENVDRWLFRIAQNTWYNEVRNRAVRKMGHIDSESLAVADLTQDVESSFAARETMQHVLALPEAQRVCVMLVYVEGFSYQEAADILHVPIGTIMSRLSAARLKLNKANDAGQRSGREKP
jgi:RNA polymerase sigma-70 factor, ECF subfamily